MDLVGLAGEGDLVDDPDGLGVPDVQGHHVGGVVHLGTGVGVVPAAAAGDHVYDLAHPAAVGDEPLDAHLLHYGGLGAVGDVEDDQLGPYLVPGIELHVHERAPGPEPVPVAIGSGDYHVGAVVHHVHLHRVAQDARRPQSHRVVGVGHIEDQEAAVGVEDVDVVAHHLDQVRLLDVTYLFGHLGALYRVRCLQPKYVVVQVIVTIVVVWGIVRLAEVLLSLQLREALELFDIEWLVITPGNGLFRVHGLDRFWDQHLLAPLILHIGGRSFRGILLRVLRVRFEPFRIDR